MGVAPAPDETNSKDVTASVRNRIGTTVKSHLIHIYRKLGADDRTHAVTVALLRGLIRLGADKP